MKSYVTLLSSKNYLKGVLVLHYSLKKVNSACPLLVLLSDELQDMEEVKAALKTYKIEFKILERTLKLPEDVATKIYSKRWIKTFDKLQVFGLTCFEKIVFLDSDMLIIRNIDSLFEKPHLTFATASEQVSGYEDWILPNSGMMVLEPKENLPDEIFAVWAKVQARKSDFSDQDLIHEYFKELIQKNNSWRVPAVFNCFVYLIDKIYKERGYNLKLKNPDKFTISVLHFAITDRPWMMSKKQIFKFYLERFFKGQFQEIKAYTLYFKALFAIKR